MPTFCLFCLPHKRLLLQTWPPWARMQKACSMSFTAQPCRCHCCRWAAGWRRRKRSAHPWHSSWRRRTRRAAAAATPSSPCCRTSPSSGAFCALMRSTTGYSWASTAEGQWFDDRLEIQWEPLDNVPGPPPPPPPPGDPTDRTLDEGCAGCHLHTGINWRPRTGIWRPT